ncbi:beta-N-acetylhexosaminidase [Flavobacteriaceae bacterium F08102]|nr:beta-N-acetylhexosaminidase [Flavobacteriaceae bacterium F08102]
MKPTIPFRFLMIIMSCAFGLGLGSCVKERPSVPKDLAQEALIPLPQSVHATGVSFAIDKDTKITYQQPDLAIFATDLSEYLGKSTGFKFSTKEANSPTVNTIHFALVDSIAQAEGYVLNITPEAITLIAKDHAGIFYGMQTLHQLLPAQFEAGLMTKDTVYVASGRILDFPSYSYRGAMLDVVRHFFTVEDVKRYIDLLASYKINKLHLHLSDDQGWRIEIKSWPKLTEHGGSTEVGGGVGGFYTQEDYKNIVAYAQKHFITIVPEIDMPGHTNAALSSYPELNCDGKAPKLYTGTRVGFSTLCTEKEITYTFIDDVVREILAMTPGPYFHIGGDESHATPLDKYIPFINRVQAIVKKYDKKVIGWDEIAHADLDSTVVVQFWAQEENAVRGIKKGAKVLMSPAKRAYLDMKYDSLTKTGLTWAAYIEVDQGYTWSLEEYAEGVHQEDIIGVEAPLWSETVSTIDEVEFLAFPRLMGIAEIGWTAAAKRSWDHYKLRLAKHQVRLDAKKVHYYKSPKVPWNN